MQTPNTETAAQAANKPDPLGLDTLATMPLAALRQAWLALGEGDPPMLPEALLRRLLAHRLREQRHGGLPARVVRKLERLASGESEDKPGRGLVVRDDGFVWEERDYTSLSQIAREVTGAHWSGPRFFGLARHG